MRVSSGWDCEASAAVAVSEGAGVSLAEELAEGLADALGEAEVADAPADGDVESVVGESSEEPHADSVSNAVSAVTASSGR
ncbi:hypothetical protein RGB72_12720 [Glutamicibacter protophormiae]|nr:hypothetical protein RGB72_12720 [Glutamicibacter protophormiae]